MCKLTFLQTEHSVITIVLFEADPDASKTPRCFNARYVLDMPCIGQGGPSKCLTAPHINYTLFPRGTVSRMWGSRRFTNISPNSITSVTDTQRNPPDAPPHPAQGSPPEGGVIVSPLLPLPVVWLCSFIADLHGKADLRIREPKLKFCPRRNVGVSEGTR